jgi:AI-2 transport protein TqsA
MGATGRSLLVIAALVVIAAGIHSAQAVVVPFLLAIFIATIAGTPMFWLEQRRVPAWLAIPLVMAGVIAVLVGVGMLAAQSVSEFTARLPFYQTRLLDLLGTVIGRLEPFGIEVSPQMVRGYLDPGVALSLAGNTLRGLGGVLSNGFLILLTVIFILSEAASFPRKLRAVLRDPDRDLPHFARFAVNVNRYIAIKTTISVATGLLVWLSLALIGVDFPVLWGLIAFLFNYIPNIGSIIAAVPAVLLALIQLGPGPAVLVAGIYVLVNLVMGNAVEPRYMGKGLGLSPLVVFLSLVFWGWMLGPVGMLLSVPLTMTAKIALEANPSSRWLALLLGPADATAPVGAPAAPADDDEATRQA